MEATTPKALGGAFAQAVRATLHTRQRADAATMAAAVQAFHATEAAWSLALCQAYNCLPGSKAYDRARYHTPHADWPAAVRTTYATRDAARIAWERACGMA